MKFRLKKTLEEKILFCILTPPFHNPIIGLWIEKSYLTEHIL